MLPVKAPRVDDVRTVFDFSDRWRAELEKFFLAAVAFEGKDLKVLGWNGPSEANQLIKKSLIMSDDGEPERVGQADGRAAHRG